jgi:hypothetical protein
VVAGVSSTTPAHAVASSSRKHTVTSSAQLLRARRCLVMRILSSRPVRTPSPLSNGGRTTSGTRPRLAAGTLRRIAQCAPYPRAQWPVFLSRQPGKQLHAALGRYGSVSYPRDACVPCRSHEGAASRSQTHNECTSTRTTTPDRAQPQIGFLGDTHPAGQNNAPATVCGARRRAQPAHDRLPASRAATAGPCKKEPWGAGGQRRQGSDQPPSFVCAAEPGAAIRD